MGYERCEDEKPIELDPSRIVVNRSVQLGNPVHSFISTHPGVPPDPMKLHPAHSSQSGVRTGHSQTQRDVRGEFFGGSSPNGYLTVAKNESSGERRETIVLEVGEVCK